MKARLLIVLAAVAMLFTACRKDNEPQLENNTLVYDGVTYHFQSQAYHGNEGVFHHYLTTMSQGGGLHEMSVHFSAENLSQTLDLTQTHDNVELDCYCSLESPTSTHIGFSYYQNSYAGSINEPNLQDGTIFSAGTFTSVYDDSGVTFTLVGTLINGKTLAYKVFVPKNQIETN